MTKRKFKMKLSSRRNGTLVPDDDSDSDLQEFSLPKKRIIKPGKSTYVARRRCGCCRVCASVFLSVLLIASVLCVVVLGWFSLRLKRDLDFMRRRLSKGKSWFFWIEAGRPVYLLSFRPHQRRCWRCTVWVLLLSLLHFNTLFYGKSVCNCVVPEYFYYKVSVLTVTFFFNFDLILLNFRNPRNRACSQRRLSSMKMPSNMTCSKLILAAFYHKSIHKKN